MLLANRFFRICLGIIALLLIVYLTAKVSFLFQPLRMIFNILIVPFALAGFFYYLLRPVMRYLVERRMNRLVAILFIYLALGAILAAFSIIVWPTLLKQIDSFIAGAPGFIEDFRDQLMRLQNNRLFSIFVSNESGLTDRMSEYLNQAITSASEYVTNVIAVVTSFVIVVTTAPFILYYMLKQGEAIPTSVLHLVPRRYRKDGEEVLTDIDSALSGFIIGRMIITFLLGVMMYIGFMLIGLPFALLVTVISTILNIIPYIGPILGAIPCVIVAFTDSPSMVLWVLVVTIIAQQVEGNLLSPLIYGKRLEIHPLTTIILLLIAGEISGILGVILALPFYMVIKIIVVRVYQLFFAEKVEELVE
ncbi:AI-2E family transporter [Paenibacillus mendelii]|uniref:AI-2E family transporter n=1 Tax=Paenibacillus mendelii TaxID=206163 RepID=A0ABV6JJ18_9BACL|nr:AI-2E family transporter [Paenibacillus mendelii]MCQ6558835.1 AI-2E family transporter [Paenibacillus mendelii]